MKRVYSRTWLVLKCGTISVKTQLKMFSTFPQVEGKDRYFLIWVVQIQDCLMNARFCSEDRSQISLLTITLKLTGRSSVTGVKRSVSYHCSNWRQICGGSRQSLYCTKLDKGDKRPSKSYNKTRLKEAIRRWGKVTLIGLQHGAMLRPRYNYWIMLAKYIPVLSIGYRK